MRLPTSPGVRLSTLEGLCRGRLRWLGTGFIVNVEKGQDRPDPLPIWTHRLRVLDDGAITAHAAIRFRSEYDYARFEYWRSAKVLGYLQRAGVSALGRVLDDGGGMSVSSAEEADSVVAIDLIDRFRDAGTRLALEKSTRNVTFACADATRLPLPSRSFDLVLSHAVIEHVADPAAYLQEARRVLKPGGFLFLQTAVSVVPWRALARA